MMTVQYNEIGNIRTERVEYFNSDMKSPTII